MTPVTISHSVKPIIDNEHATIVISSLFYAIFFTLFYYVSIMYLVHVSSRINGIYCVQEILLSTYISMGGAACIPPILAIPTTVFHLLIVVSDGSLVAPLTTRHAQVSPLPHNVEARQDVCAPLNWFGDNVCRSHTDME